MTNSLITRQGICAAVITFNPGRESLNNFTAIRENGHVIIIVDNGSVAADRKELDKLAIQPGVHLLANGTNLGIAAALNQAVLHARLLGYRWLLCFDQDSLPLCDMRDYFLQIYNNHPSPDRIAVIGSGYIDINYPAPADNSSSDGALWKDMKRVITSGSLLSIDAYDRLGQFQEEFFIDMVDREYCYRARENGFIVIQTTRPLIAHSIGAYKGHNFIGMEVWTSNHSALRRYFITRNRLLVQRKYQRVNYFWRATSLLKVIRKCISVCLYESHKIAKVRAMLAGWWHGVNGVLTPPLWIRRQVGYVWKNPG